jgi:hypothetical protein
MEGFLDKYVGLRQEFLSDRCAPLLPTTYWVLRRLLLHAFVLLLHTIPEFDFLQLDKKSYKRIIRVL